MAAPKKPDPYEKLALLQMLTHGHAQADAYIDTIGDAAALAANQVQDVRLEYLEKGPTVTAADVVLELLLATALQYVGGTVVEVATRAAMNRILASRRALLLVTSRTELGDKVAATYRAAKLEQFVETGPGAASQFRSLMAEGDAALRSTLLREGDAEVIYTDTPFRIADHATKIVFHAGRQVPQRPISYTRLSPLDSPGVAVLDNASLFVVRQKTFNKILFDGVAQIVLLDLLSQEEVLLLVKELEVYVLGLHGSQPLSDIKQHYKLFFEACIWSRILDPPPPLRGVPPVFEVGDRGKELTEYLLARIVDPHQEVPFAELVRELPPHARRRPDEPTNVFFVLQSLLDHFRRLRETGAALEAELPSSAQTKWNYP
jgi:hypothetical protein